MHFREDEPTFTLNLSLDESIALWHIVNKAVEKGNEKAKPFKEALYEFAANSNSYT